MTNLRIRRLSDINHEIRNLRVAAIVGEICHAFAREEIGKLEDERERLWQTV